MKRYLVTTADTRTWKFDRPIIFLGEWCRRYDLKSKWSVLDAIVAKPFGVKNEEKLVNTIYIESLKNKLLSELTIELNDFHKTKHNVRYWHMLLGHWLQHYVEILFNRYFTIEELFKNNDLSGTTLFESADFYFATNDTYGILDACRDDVWNHFLFAEIITYLNVPKLQVENFKLDKVKSFDRKTSVVSLKTFILNTTSRFLLALCKKNDAVIVNSYLPKIDEIKLSLALGQCPQIWRTQGVRKENYSYEKRKSFKLKTKNHSGFECFIREQIGNFLPVCYVEGFKQLLSQVNAYPWPSEARFIFTSNNFDTDEIFKVWAATMVERGVKYFVGQHGNNYGTLMNYYNRTEIVTADNFFTWGWTDGNSKNIPAFLFKTLRRKSEYQINGGLLLIELLLLDRRFHMDDSFECCMFQDLQFRFVNSLSLEIQKALTVRLPLSYKNHDWFDELRWRDFNPQINLNVGVGRIEKLTKKSRLVVHSYDSTGLLETLSLNIPTLSFFYGGVEHIVAEARPYYELLIKVGIIVETPEAAAEFINSYWENIEEWWNSDDVQSARQIFCERYAKYEKKPIRKLKLLLTQSTMSKNAQ